jgi:ferredoxin
MSRNATDSRPGAQLVAVTDGGDGTLPPVTRDERDFWRRAVAEERQRLELSGYAAPPGLRSEVH